LKPTPVAYRIRATRGQTFPPVDHDADVRYTPMPALGEMGCRNLGEVVVGRLGREGASAI
jgi:hypothetical protein